MKKFITPFFALSFLLLSQVSGSAQRITTVNYIDSCFFGGGGYFQPVVQFTSPTSLNSCKLETDFGDGSKLDTVSIVSSGGSNYYTYATAHQYAVAGTYTLRFVLFCGSTRIDTFSSGQNISCSYVGGTLYNDANSNCVYNSTENEINGMGKIEIDSAGVKIDTLFAYGHWWYKPLATVTTVYKFKLITPPTGTTNTCPGTGLITYTYSPSPIFVSNLDFGFNCSATPAFDYALFYSRALRGSSSPAASFIKLYASNSSCHNGTSTVTLNVSPKYSIVAANITPAPASISGNTVTWTLSGLSYGTRMLFVPLVPLSTTNNGDTACNNAIITPLTGDANTANNSFAICDSVRASWDPNEKSVLPSGPVSAGTQLTYTIDFENLGNDTAFNVHVQDTLSANLNVNTFQLIASTHPVYPYVYQAGGMNIIKFDFPAINLEDKNHTDRNKGQVRFTINLKSGLPAGSVTTNRAGIYFDGNPVVLTNYAYSSIPSPNSVEELKGNQQVRVFPNPAGDVLNLDVKGNGWSEAILSNAVGQVVARQSLRSGTNTLRVAQLPAGIYILLVQGTNGRMTQKIVKQ